MVSRVGGHHVFPKQDLWTRTKLQVVENRWEGGRSRHRGVATLRRLDQLQQSGQLAALLISGALLTRSVLLLSEHAHARLKRGVTGPLWEFLSLILLEWEELCPMEV